MGFRFFAEREAKSLGIYGYVKNLSNGNVEAYAVGAPDSLESFKSRLASGPPAAKVTQVQEIEQPVNRKYSSFLVEG